MIKQVKMLRIDPTNKVVPNQFSTKVLECMLEEKMPRAGHPQGKAEL